MPYITQKQFEITVTIDGETFGPWAESDGFDAEGGDTRIFPGNMLPAVAIGGQADISPGVLTKFYDPIKDKVKVWQQKCGEVEASCTIRPKDRQGKVFDQIGETYRGILSNVSRPKKNSGSNDGAQVAITITPHGEVA